ncbi:hypothetical protein AB205_0190750 [Aquarana catesbeiana]|uniref:SH3 domain-containing protein n=1 Tax=Aquarana catesbeiana TaxID=8400 RepID=A0A2G9SJQ6_AQUCT|nr:hypothetical protein AB205_0190750 [Aquarana catesbeiana]
MLTSQPYMGSVLCSSILSVAPQGKRTNLRKNGSERIAHGMRVKFNPLALLLDSSLEGEFDLVQRIIYELESILVPPFVFAVEDPSEPNDEGITALHNAVCAGHTEIVKFLVQFGVNVNAADSDGWTPLHCAASCNNVQVCKFLVECGAAVFATTYSDRQTAADKCEEMEEGYSQCSQFLYEKMGIMNRGVLYALWDNESDSNDELSLKEGDCMTIIRREDEDETEWWWARIGDKEGYVPRNLLGLYPRIKQRQRTAWASPAHLSLASLWPAPQPTPQRQWHVFLAESWVPILKAAGLLLVPAHYCQLHGRPASQPPIQLRMEEMKRSGHVTVKGEELEETPFCLIS